MPKAMIGALPFFAIKRACCPQASAADIEAAHQCFKRLESEEVKLNFKIHNSNWRLKLKEALAKGAGLAHRISNRSNITPANITAPLCHTPILVANYHAAKWETVWNCGDILSSVTSDKLLRDLRASVLDSKRDH